MAEKVWYLKQVDWLSQLTADEAARLEARAMMRRFRKGEMVYFAQEAGETVLLLATGRIKLKNVTPDGKEAILAFIEEGELFGELALLDRTPRGEFAEAVLESQVIAIPAAELQTVMQKRPDVALGITRLVGLRRRRIQNRLQNILFRSNRERVTHLLLELLETHGVRDGSQWQIGIRLSHQDLASLIGATRESVTLILGQLQLEKLIRVRRRQLTVLDRDRLLAESNGVAAVTPVKPTRDQRGPRVSP
ncbi:MAG: Crp/Fnr family transcriptional regulator [Pirellulales bacterium]